MDIYMQEITALVYLQRVPQETKSVVLTVADSFVNVVGKAEVFLKANVPVNAWAVLFHV